MEIIPSQIIGFKNVQSNGGTFYGYNPVTGKALTTAFHEALGQDINEAVALAQEAFNSYRKTTPVQRSLFLEAIAANIDALGDDLLNIINEETALPIARLTGERGRTTGQLKLFADLLKEGSWNKPIVDEALPERKPAPRPLMIQMQVALGVVAVFGASNFPLAFSVAGGDTAAALAAGCPVVFKAHPAHPATCQLIGDAIAKAAKDTQMPDGTFSLIHGLSHDTGSLLITHPFIKAVAFTGSFKGGKALYDLAAKRKEPIPVYAEMGSVNPVFFLPGSIQKGGDTLVTQFAQSVTLGSGQFCTNPGIAVFIDNEESRSFIEKLTNTLTSASISPMLTKGISDAYQSGLEKQHKLSGATSLIDKSDSGIHAGLTSVSAKKIIQHTAWFEEVFGPSTVVVLAEDFEEMLRVAEIMPGQLTGTIQASEDDYPKAMELIDALSQKAGRIVMNGFPTGVEVSHAMVHGGPYPATTNSRVTSVGTTSIYRFTRPACYQNIPVSWLAVSNA
jgi:alpha-ketoglutaric semialdehyde dehydrogenase